MLYKFRIFQGFKFSLHTPDDIHYKIIDKDTIRLHWKDLTAIFHSKESIDREIKEIRKILKHVV